MSLQPQLLNPMRAKRKMTTKSKRKSATNKNKVLKRVCAMVNVCVGDDATIDCSRIIASKLESLGATIMKRFTPKITHLVIHEYNSEWKERIIKWQQIIKRKSILNLHIVSPLWVQACLTSNSHEEESKYFPVTCDAKSLVKENIRPKSAQLSRFRKQKRRLSMEPVRSRSVFGECSQKPVDIKTKKEGGTADLNQENSHETLRKEVEEEAERLVREARIRRRMTIAGEFISSAEGAIRERVSAGYENEAYPARKIAAFAAIKNPSDSTVRKKRAHISNETIPKAFKETSEMIDTRATDISSSKMSGACENVQTKSEKNTLNESISSQISQQSRFIISMSAIEPEDRMKLEEEIQSLDSVHGNIQGYRKSRVMRSSDVSVPFTHLIIGKDTRRTLKVLFGLARGAWILSDAWISSSLISGQWLPEREFEILAYMRKEERPCSQIFTDLKFFVGSNVAPSRKTLQSLIKCTGGEISNQITKANYCVCEDGSFSRRLKNTGTLVVPGKWVFDSVANLALQDSDSSRNQAQSSPNEDGKPVVEKNDKLVLVQADTSLSTERASSPTGNLATEA
uniref:Uncharacterized protein AlNc14C232G9308 n=1 Tax=Albugo laibachii Nc14 TaxID=890382 RepID=F0WSG6_9STRA|nr:conserved hypothetical protein [Albugo laibachii Nc14]|eukprot:CCA24288.1 conserved hypothetical protein [Albugo laibachii Nc14]